MRVPVEKRAVRSQRCELFRGPGFEIEDRGGGTEGLGVEFEWREVR